MEPALIYRTEFTIRWQSAGAPGWGNWPGVAGDGESGAVVAVEIRTAVW